MVHPKVLQAARIDPTQGRACLGMGIDRIAIAEIRHPDLRAFYRFRPALARGHYGFAFSGCADAAWRVFQRCQDVGTARKTSNKLGGITPTQRDGTAT